LAVKNINDEISRCIIQLLLKEPFYAHLLSGIVRNYTDEISTAAVGIKDGKANLFINEQFFLKELTTFSSRVAVIKHETLHLLFKHLFRMDLKQYNLKVFNIAADIVVNQYIGNWDLPKSAVTLSSFPDLNLVKDESVEWYYKKITDLKTEIEKSKKNKNNSSVDTDYSSLTAPLSASSLERILTSESHSNHSKWGIFDSNNNAISAETDLDRLIIQAKDRTSVKDYGNIPLELQTLINVIIDKRNPKINWKRALKIFSSSSRKTKVNYTIKKISKRYGTRPGTKIRRYQKLAVAIDTSGSIDINEFSIFFSEIYAMWNNGAEIEIIECDAAVQRCYQYDGNLPKYVKGGGGTSFDPVFKHINKERLKKYDGCIYLTDGYAPEPTTKPNCKVFWVITPDGTLGENLKFGRAVKIVS
jgi:predicted metal-dependent peptidase